MLINRTILEEAKFILENLKDKVNTIIDERAKSAKNLEDAKTLHRSQKRVINYLEKTERVF